MLSSRIFLSRTFVFCNLPWYYEDTNLREAEPMKEKRQITVDRDEWRLLIRALVDKRNEFLAHDLEPYEVNELLLKVIDAPRKRLFGRRDEQ